MTVFVLLKALFLIYLSGISEVLSNSESSEEGGFAESPSASVDNSGNKSESIINDNSTERNGESAISYAPASAMPSDEHVTSTVVIVKKALGDNMTATHESSNEGQGNLSSSTSHSHSQPERGMTDMNKPIQTTNFDISTEIRNSTEISTTVSEPWHINATKSNSNDISDTVPHSILHQINGTVHAVRISNGTLRNVMSENKSHVEQLNIKQETGINNTALNQGILSNDLPGTVRDIYHMEEMEGKNSNVTVSRTYMSQAEVSKNDLQMNLVNDTHNSFGDDKHSVVSNNTKTEDVLTKTDVPFVQQRSSQRPASTDLSSSQNESSVQSNDYSTWNTVAHHTDAIEKSSQMPVCSEAFCNRSLECPAFIPKEISHKIEVTFCLLGNSSIQANIPKLFELHLRRALDEWECNSIVRISFNDGNPYAFRFFNATINDSSYCDANHFDELERKVFKDDGSPLISDSFSNAFLPTFKIQQFKIMRHDVCVFGTAGLSSTTLAMLIVLILSVIPCVALIFVKYMHSRRLRSRSKRSHRDMLRPRQAVLFDSERVGLHFMKNGNEHDDDAIIEIGCHNYGYDGKPGDFKTKV